MYNTKLDIDKVNISQDKVTVAQDFLNVPVLLKFYQQRYHFTYMMEEQKIYKNYRTYFLKGLSHEK